MLGKNHLFLTPSRTDRRVPSEQGAPTRTLQPDVLGSFPADVCPKITGQFGSDHSANEYHIAGTLHNKSPQTSCTVCFPATLSFQGDIIFPKCPSHQNFNCMQNRYMRSRSIGPSLQSYMTSLGSCDWRSHRTANVDRTPSRKWEQNSNWPIAGQECGSILSIRLFVGRSVA